jgi:hypothetical protein
MNLQPNRCAKMTASSVRSCHARHASSTALRFRLGNSTRVSTAWSNKSSLAMLGMVLLSPTGWMSQLAVSWIDHPRSRLAVTFRPVFTRVRLTQAGGFEPVLGLSGRHVCDSGGNNR